jgi:Phospholipid-translocating P-type ATPase C-terminal
MWLQDVKAEVVEQNPGLYAETMSTTRAGFFGGTLRWVSSALWHSVVALTVPLLALWAPDSSGKSSGGLTAFGMTAYTAIVLIVNLKVGTWYELLDRSIPMLPGTTAHEPLHLDTLMLPMAPQSADCIFCR